MATELHRAAMATATSGPGHGGAGGAGAGSSAPPASPASLSGDDAGFGAKSVRSRRGFPLEVRTHKEPFQSTMTTIATPKRASKRDGGSPFNKTILVAPTEPPPPVVTQMVAHHPRKAGRRRGKFNRHSKVLFQGPLMKMKVMDRDHDDEKAWHRRFCQIRDGFFLWFERKGAKKPAGWVRVRDIMAVRMCDAAMHLPGVDEEMATRTFQVTTSARALYLRAKTTAAMQDWMRTLVSSNSLTPAVHKSFAFPDIQDGSPVRQPALPRIESMGSKEEEDDVARRPLRRKHSRAKKHHKHKHHKHKHRKRRSRSRSPARPEGKRGDKRKEDASEAKDAVGAEPDATPAATPTGGDGGSADGKVSEAGSRGDAADDSGYDSERSSVGGKEKEGGEGAAPATPKDKKVAAVGAMDAAVKTPGSTTSLDDWEAQWDAKTSQTVYVNKATGEKQTSIPDFEETGDGKWVKCYDYDANKEYYFHTTTGETQYEQPEGFVEAPENEQAGWGWGGWDKKMATPTATALPEAAKEDTEDGSTAADEAVEEVVHWIECWDNNYNCPYYVNMDTNESVWERPTGPHALITQYVEEEGEVEAEAAEGVDEDLVAVGVEPASPVAGRDGLTAAAGSPAIAAVRTPGAEGLSEAYVPDEADEVEDDFDLSGDAF